MHLAYERETEKTPPTHAGSGTPRGSTAGPILPADPGYVD